ncbi:DJ-1/PfpI family protein [Spirosoma foliorum]|uniref:DJ-1/PfpI family protein n=1 Tax=Spirosoma foliorum TaxID=2710596 RepID=A0A7G5H2T9_9BACT|nr:DJ-1/PfpI family protein [Spirosoma foliorum]QMW05431.1 DJ-1/PfpI family protein [Spirosoma foliorum]
MTKINVAVLVYPGFELIDMNGPIDVFVKANRYNQHKNVYQVFTVAESLDEIRSEHSTVRITPDYALSNSPQPDIIVIPGKIMSTDSPEGFGSVSNELITWIKKQAQHTGITIMSVCVGIYILAKTGLLANRRATTHWLSISDVQEQYPDIMLVKNVRFVPDGNIITTGGVTSGIDGALYLLETMEDPDFSQKIADIMVYNREAPLPPNTLLT